VLNVGTVAPDNNSTYNDKIISKFNITGDEAWKAIGAWSFCAMRLMDYLETDPDVDAARSAVIGHSRGGKASLLCGAFDERFALVCSNDSGCTGAALARRKSGERLADINDRFPYWFCTRYRDYNNAEETLPVDQHELIALVAPRRVHIGAASTDWWADNKGMFYACVYAQPVYELYGYTERTWTPSDLPAAGQVAVNGRMAYHLRSGDHDLTVRDWERYLDHADRFMSSGNPPVIDSPPNALPSPAQVGETVAFSVSASDPDLDPVTYEWDFGDGTTSSEQNPTHAYAAANEYTVVVTATAGGQGVSAELTLVVEAEADYALVVNTAGTGSGGVTLDPDGGVYAEGTVVTLTASVDSGSRFAGWSGDLSGTANPATLTMDGNKTVTATFNTLASPGDLNGDGVVNVDDLVLVTSHFGQEQGDANWDPLADANGDGVISIDDLGDVTSSFGKTYP
jgi:PKD repeat protein